MDHRTRANDYARQLKEAKDRIFELECELADLTDRGPKGHQTTTAGHQAPTHQDLLTPSAEPNITVEASTSPDPQGNDAELREENARLKSDLEAYFTWTESIKEETDVAPADVVATLKNLKVLAESAKGTEAALRQQLRNHVAKAKKQTEGLEKSEKARDQAVKEVRKYRTDARRFLETGMKAVWIKDIEGSPAKAGKVGSGTLSAANSPTVGTPRTPGSSGRMRGSFVEEDEDDDEDEDVPLKQRRASGAIGFSR